MRKQGCKRRQRMSEKVTTTLRAWASRKIPNPLQQFSMLEFGVEISKTVVDTHTDRTIESMQEWCQLRLDIDQDKILKGLEAELPEIAAKPTAAGSPADHRNQRKDPVFKGETHEDPPKGFNIPPEGKRATADQIGVIHKHVDKMAFHKRAGWAQRYMYDAYNIISECELTKKDATDLVGKIMATWKGKK
jgi:hypothetical protein